MPPEPVVVRVPQYIPLPAECGALVPLALPKGTTALEVMEAQNAALLTYELRVRACFKTAP